MRERRSPILFQGALIILLQNKLNGDCYVWDMKGRETIASGPLNLGLGVQWQVKSTGDYNGDGISDILFQNSDNSCCYVWEMKPNGPGDHGYVGWTPGTSWLVVA